MSKGHQVPTVLMVEDDDASRGAMCAILEQLGWTVLCAESSQQAVQKADGYQGAIDILVADLTLKEGHGGALAKHLLLAKPNLACLFISGRSPNDPQICSLLADPTFISRRVEFLEKPFTAGTLVATLNVMMAEAH